MADTQDNVLDRAPAQMDARHAQDRLWAAHMALAQAGDAARYTILLRLITPYIRSIARRRISAADVIEDIVQETLISVHRVRHTYDPARPFMPWLYAIADRRTLDALRRHCRQRQREVPEDGHYETFSDPAANRPSEQLDAPRQLAQLMASLTPQQREAVALVKLQEMTLTQAAAVSGQSVASLKVNIHRALNKLRGQTSKGPLS